ncbi:STM4015 family protein [Actinoplanes sp. NPDC051851]|uniref:STM4015 family protein n=1 Tax=Actinoplanes sp. NPDC051851 TaxID=3154753 RepID=UPI00343750DE
MTFNDHYETFDGLRVVEFPLEGPLPEVTGPVAWRVAHWDVGDEAEGRVSAEFTAVLDRFVDLAGAETTHLVIGAWGYAAVNVAPLEHFAALAPRLPRLRALFFGDVTFDECEISWMKVGDVSRLLAAYPALEVLRVRGGEEFGFSPVRHERLRDLAVESGGLPKVFLDAVLASELPALTGLELWLGVEDYGGDITPADLASILAGSAFPGLRRLGLRNAEHANAIAAAVAGAPVVQQLAELALSMGTFDDEGVGALLAGQPLTHLDALDLHFHFMTGEGSASIVAALPGVRVDVSDPQLTGGPHAGRRYTKVSE